MVEESADFYDVVLASNSVEAKAWNIRAACEDTGGAFLQAAQSFDEWVAKLWELYGTGEHAASMSQKQMCALLTVRKHHYTQLKLTPSLALDIFDCAEAFDSCAHLRLCLAEENASFMGELRLTPQEAELLSCVNEYHVILKQHNLLDQLMMLDYLASLKVETFVPQSLYFVGNTPPTARQLAFFEASKAWLSFARDKTSQDLFTVPLSQLPRHVIVGTLLPAGPAAQAQLVLNAIEDARPTLPQASALVGEQASTSACDRASEPAGDQASAQTILVTALDPLKLFLTLAPVLQKQGFSVSVNFSTKFEQTNFGLSFLSAYRSAQDGVYWNKDALTDSFHLAAHGATDKQYVWNLDTQLRGNRALSHKEVFDAIRQSQNEIFEFFNELVSGKLPSKELEDSYFCTLRAHALNQTDIAEQSVAYRKLSILYKAAAEFGIQQVDDLISLLQHMNCIASYEAEPIDVKENQQDLEGLQLVRDVQADQGPQGSQDPQTQEGPLRVHFCTQSAALQFEEASYDTLIICDLSSNAYPLREARSSALCLLDRLGVHASETPLQQARREFRALLSLARKRVIFERPFNDENLDELYPSAMLSEIFQAYSKPPAEITSAADAATLAPPAPPAPPAETATSVETAPPAETSDPSLYALGSYGIPRVLLQLSYEGGEEKLACAFSPQPQLSDTTNSFLHIAQPSRSFVGDMQSVCAPHNERQHFPELPRLSASQIESYLKCPYQWLVNNRLSARSIDEKLDQAHIGSFLHEIFQAFYSSFRQKVSCDNLVEALTCMFGDGASDAHSGGACSNSKGIFDEVLQAQLACDKKGLRRDGSFVILEGTQERFLLDNLRTQVRDWLYAECAFLPDFSPLAFECKIEGVPFAGAEISGLIDRVDVDAQGNAVIIDYKGSLDDSYRPLKSGELNENAKVQGLIYAQILQKAGGLTILPLQNRWGVAMQHATIDAISCAPAAEQSAAEQGSRFVPIKRVIGALYFSYKKGNPVAGAFDAVFLDSESIPTLSSPQNCALGQASAFSFQDLLEINEQRVCAAVKAIAAAELAVCPQNSQACMYCPVIDCEGRAYAANA